MVDESSDDDESTDDMPDLVDLVPNDEESERAEGDSPSRGESVVEAKDFLSFPSDRRHFNFGTLMTIMTRVKSSAVLNRDRLYLITWLASLISVWRTARNRGAGSLQRLASHLPLPRRSAIPLMYLALSEGIWFVLIKYVLYPRHWKSMALDDLGEYSWEQFRNRLVPVVKQIIQINPRKYWEAVAYPVKLESIRLSTVRTVVLGMTRNHPKAKNFLQEKEIDDIVGEFQDISGHQFNTDVAKTPQKVHIEGWAAPHPTTNIYVLPLCMELCVHAFEWAASSWLRVARGWKSYIAENGAVSCLALNTPEPGSCSDEPPLVIFHGLGGWAFYAPTLVRWLQQKYPRRCIVMLQVLGVEVRQLQKPVSWHATVEGISNLLHQIHPGRKVDGGVLAHDVLAHSYGNHVANRWIRYCFDEFPYTSAGSSNKSSIFEGGSKFFAVRKIFWLETPTFGSTSSGFACGAINSRVPMKNFALVANKQGLPWIETVLYKLPPGVQSYVYCSPQDDICPMEHVKDQVPRYIPDAVIFASKCSWTHACCFIPGSAASREIRDQFLWKYM